MTRATHRRRTSRRLSPLTMVTLLLAVGFAAVGLATSIDGRHPLLIIAAILGALSIVTAHDDCARSRR